MFEQGSPLEEAFWNVAASEEARRRLVEALHYELLGPEREDEELSESPVTRYVTGLLAPFGTGVLPTEQDVSLAAGDDDNETGALEGAPPMSQAMTPSSIGISFLVSDGVEAVMTEASWGEYERLKSDEKDAPDKGSEQAGFEEDEAPPPEETGDEGRSRRRPRWKRRPVTSDPVEVKLAPDAGLQRIPLDDHSEITLEHLTRRGSPPRRVREYALKPFRELIGADSPAASDTWAPASITESRVACWRAPSARGRIAA